MARGKSILGRRRPSRPLPDISGDVVSIADLRSHARHKRLLRRAVEGLARAVEEHKAAIHAEEVAEAVVYQLLDYDSPSSVVMATALIANVIEWLAEAGEDPDRILSGLRST